MGEIVLLEERELTYLERVRRESTSEIWGACVQYTMGKYHYILIIHSMYT